MAAILASDGAHDLALIFRRESYAAQVGRRVITRLGGRLAKRTKFAHETLGDESAHGTGDEEGFDVHVEEAGDAADRIVGVKGAEDQVTGEGGTNGNFGRLVVAHFADHDDIGVTAEETAQEIGEGVADLGLDRALVHPGQLVLDRILDGEDAAFLGVESREKSVKRR